MSTLSCLRACRHCRRQPSQPRGPSSHALLPGVDAVQLAFQLDFPPCVLMRRLLEHLQIGCGCAVWVAVDRCSGWFVVCAKWLAITLWLHGQASHMPSFVCLQLPRMHRTPFLPLPPTGLLRSGSRGCCANQRPCRSWWHQMR